MRNVLLTALLALGISSSQAQTFYGSRAQQVHPQAAEVRFDHRSSAPLYIGFQAAGFVAASAGMEGLRGALGAGPDDSWQLLRSDRDDLGMTHHRYQQYYRQVKVLTGEYILHEQKGKIASANGMFHAPLNLSVQPGLSEKTALTAALNSVGSSLYLWQASEKEQEILSGHHHGDVYPKGELVILPPVQGSAAKSASLTWRFDIYSLEPHERWIVFVDATTGKVLFKENKICTVTVNATAATRYSGTVTMQVDSLSAGNYRLRDYSRGAGVETFDLNNGTTYTSAVDFTNTTSFWNTTTNFDNAAYDAHWGTQKTYDYYFLTHNRNSYNNAGAVLRSYIHYSSNYANAFWNGSVMTYGDGNGSTFSPLTELDIIAHELTHGVTEFSSNLVYSYESGALNESFSDIFGVTVDFYARPGVANFLIGDQSYTPGTAGDALRYMNNPGLAGDPDTYLGTNWYTGSGDNGGVHINSGVQNFWYYLLCQGGAGTNDLGFAYNVAGIGMNKARMIAYRNNSFYLTSGSQYDDAAFYALKSANDLYGNCSPESYSVKNAWDAVGVYGLLINTNASAALTGSACTGGNILLVATGGTSYVWSGPGGFSSTQQNPVIPNASTANNGTYTCVVTDASGCSGSATVSVAVSPGPQVTATGGGTICNGGSLNLQATASIPGSGGNTGVNATVFNIPDANTTGITSPISISGSTTASAVVAVRIDTMIHTWVADLKIELIAPNGSVITLANGVGSSGDNFIGTRFVTGGTAIASGVAPFTGNYAPQTAFSSLTGTANGNWGLRISDLYGQDIGTLRRWTLELPGNVITSYSWSPSTGLNQATIPNPIASPAATTTYTVTVSSSNGCTTAASTTVNVGALNASVNKTNVNCFGASTGSATVTVSGGSPSYQWSNGATTPSISNLAAGVYTCTVTDPSGCSAVLPVTISAPGQIQASSNAQATTCGLSNGSANIVASGGTQPFTYLWNNGSTSTSISALAAGTYTVTATDANGCTLQRVLSVASSAGLSGNESGQATTCGLSNGSAFISVTAGTAPYTYAWSNGGTTASLASLAAGSYTVTVTDANACTLQRVVSVASSAGLSGNETAQPTTCGLSNGTASISVNTGTAPYTYAWSNGGTTASLATLAAGTYSVTVTDANACTLQRVVTVAASSSVSGSVTAQSTSCGLNNGSATVLVNGGTVPYTYSWNNGASTASLSNLPAGNYSATVTDASGCTYSGTASVAASSAMSGFITTQNASCGLNDGLAYLTFTGGQSPYTYLWSNGASTQNLSSLAPGNYTVTVTDAAGCTFVSSATVSTNGSGAPSLPGTINGTKLGVCAGTSQSYAVNPVSGATSYIWTVPSGASITAGAGTNAITVSFGNGFSSGNITVKASNNCGTSSTRSATIRSVPLTPGVISGPTKNLCGLTVTYSIAASTSGATAHTWTVPSSATLLSGQGTTSIQVRWPSTSLSSATISVVAVNACGSSTARTLGSITTRPTKPTAINGPSTVCAGQAGVAFNVTTNEPGVTYTWTVPSGATVVSGQGTNAMVMNWGTTAGTVRVVPSNTCGTATTTSKSVSFNCRTFGGDQNGSVQLLPNPSKGNAALQFSTDAGMYTVTVVDMLGHTLLRESSNASRYDIRMGNAASGLYLVSVRFADGTQQVMRMIIEK